VILGILVVQLLLLVLWGISAKAIIELSDQLNRIEEELKETQKQPVPIPRSQRTMV